MKEQRTTERPRELRHTAASVRIILIIYLAIQRPLQLSSFLSLALNSRNLTYSTCLPDPEFGFVTIGPESLNIINTSDNQRNYYISANKNDLLSALNTCYTYVARLASLAAVKD